MKTTIKFILTLLVLVFASCEKEELLEPVQEVHEVDKSVKGTAQIGPRLSLQIRRRTYNANYGLGGRRLNQGCTVRFNGNILAATTKISYNENTFREKATSHIWSSTNGSDWLPISTFPFNRAVAKMVVYKNKLWALSRAPQRYEYQLHTSTDGGLTWDLNPAQIPFDDIDPIAYAQENQDLRFSMVVFNNKIVVFGGSIIKKVGAIDLNNVYSFDGVNWDVEDIQGLPMVRDRFWGGPTIVFKDALYYFVAGDPDRASLSGIFKSTNGRDWSPVSGATTNYLNPTEDFSLIRSYSAVVHDNKVWVTGGKGRGGYGSHENYSNEIWYSGDMKNWRKYTGHVSFKPLSGPTLLSNENEMLLLGGDYESGSGRAVPSRYVWSIKPKIKYYVPVEIPRNRPTIPRF